MSKKNTVYLNKGTYIQFFDIDNSTSYKNTTALTSETINNYLLSADGNYLWATTSSGNLYKYDAKTASLLGSSSIGYIAQDFTQNSNGSILYFVGHPTGSSNVQQSQWFGTINTINMSVTDFALANAQQIGSTSSYQYGLGVSICLSSDNSYIYIAQSNINVLTVYTSSGTFIKSISLPQNPIKCVYGSGKVFVACNGVTTSAQYLSIIVNNTLSNNIQLSYVSKISDISYLTGYLYIASNLPYICKVNTSSYAQSQITLPGIYASTVFATSISSKTYLFIKSGTNHYGYNLTDTTLLYTKKSDSRLKSISYYSQVVIPISYTSTTIQADGYTWKVRYASTYPPITGTSGFTGTVNGISCTFSNISISNGGKDSNNDTYQDITLTSSIIAYKGQTCTLTYTPGNFADSSSNNLPTINVNAINNSEVSLPLTISSASIGTDGKTITINFSGGTSPISGTTGLILNIDGFDVSLYGYAFSSNTLVCYSKLPIYSGSICHLSYSSGDIYDSLKVSLSTLSNLSVTNSSSLSLVTPYSSYSIFRGVTSSSQSTYDCLSISKDDKFLAIWDHYSTNGPIYLYSLGTNTQLSTIANVTYPDVSGYSMDFSDDSSILWGITYNGYLVKVDVSSKSILSKISTGIYGCYSILIRGNYAYIVSSSSINKYNLSTLSLESSITGLSIFSSGRIQVIVDNYLYVCTNTSILKIKINDFSYSILLSSSALGSGVTFAGINLSKDKNVLYILRKDSAYLIQYQLSLNQITSKSINYVGYDIIDSGTYLYISNSSNTYPSIYLKDTLLFIGFLKSVGTKIKPMSISSTYNTLYLLTYYASSGDASSIYSVNTNTNKLFLPEFKAQVLADGYTWSFDVSSVLSTPIAGNGTSGLSVRINNTSYSISSYSISGATITFTCSTKVNIGDFCYLSYAPGNITGNGVSLGTLTNIPVNNNSIQTTTPVVLSTSDVNSDGYTWNINLSSASTLSNSPTNINILSNYLQGFQVNKDLNILFIGNSILTFNSSSNNILSQIPEHIGNNPLSYCINNNTIYYKSLNDINIFYYDLNLNSEGQYSLVTNLSSDNKYNLITSTSSCFDSLGNLYIVISNKFSTNVYKYNVGSNIYSDIIYSINKPILGITIDNTNSYLYLLVSNDSMEVSVPYYCSIIRVSLLDKSYISVNSSIPCNSDIYNWNILYSNSNIYILSSQKKTLGYIDSSGVLHNIITFLSPFEGCLSKTTDDKYIGIFASNYTTEDYFLIDCATNTSYKCSPISSFSVDNSNIYNSSFTLGKNYQTESINIKSNIIAAILNSSSTSTISGIPSSVHGFYPIINNEQHNFSSISLSGTTYVGTCDTAANEGDETLLDYIPGNVVDSSNNPMQTFAGLSITNNSTLVGPPKITSGTINSDGYTWVIAIQNYSSSLTGTKGFVGWLDDTQVSFTLGTITTTSVTLTSNIKATSDKIATLSYYSGDFVGSTSLALQEKYDLTITNSAGIIPAPTIGNAYINTDGVTWTLIFNSLATSLSGTTGFTPTIAGTATTFSSITWSGTIATAVCATTAKAGNIVSLTYASGNVVDSNSSPLVYFTNYPVNNSSTQTNPIEIDNIQIEPDGFTWHIYLKSCTAPITGTTGFSATIGSKTADINIKSISNLEIIASCGGQTLSTDNASLSYNSGDFQDYYGATISNFSNKYAYNNSTADGSTNVLAPSISSVVSGNLTATLSITPGVNISQYNIYASQSSTRPDSAFSKDVFLFSTSETLILNSPGTWYFWVEGITYAGSVISESFNIWVGGIILLENMQEPSSLTGVIFKGTPG